MRYRRHLMVGGGRTRCGAKPVTGRVSFDLEFGGVDCMRCRSLGYPYEKAPENYFRAPSFMSVSDIKRDGEVLDLHNVIFVDGGSIMWFEEPHVLAVMHVGHDGVRRYPGEWRERGPRDARRVKVVGGVL